MSKKEVDNRDQLLNLIMKLKLEQSNILRYITGKLLQINSSEEEVQNQIKQLVLELNTIGDKDNGKGN